MTKSFRVPKKLPRPLTFQQLARKYGLTKAQMIEIRRYIDKISGRDKHDRAWKKIAQCAK